MLEKLSLLIAPALLASAAGGAARVDDGPSLILLIAAGLSGVPGALFYRSAERDKAIADLSITIITVFIFAFAFGGVIGSILLSFAVQLGASMYYSTELSTYMGGGLVAGTVMLALLKAVLSKIKIRGGGEKK